MDEIIDGILPPRLTDKLVIVECGEFLNEFSVEARPLIEFPLCPTYRMGETLGLLSDEFIDLCS